MAKARLLLLTLLLAAATVPPLPASERVLRPVLDRFRAFATPEEDVPLLRQLADWLLVPLADQLTGPVVGIVPYGVLHHLPFAVLPYGAGTFGDAHALFHLPSASALPFVQAKRKDTADRVLALAQSEAEGLPTLRFATQEAETSRGCTRARR